MAPIDRWRRLALENTPIETSKGSRMALSSGNGGLPAINMSPSMLASRCSRPVGDVSARKLRQVWCASRISTYGMDILQFGRA